LKILLKTDIANQKENIDNLIIYPSYNMMTPSYFLTLAQTYHDKVEKIYIVNMEIGDKEIKVIELIAKIKGNIGQQHLVILKDYIIPLEGDIYNTTFYLTAFVNYSTDLSDLSTKIEFRLEPKDEVFSSEATEADPLIGTPIAELDYKDGTVTIRFLEDNSLDCRCGDSVVVDGEDGGMVEAKKYTTYKINDDGKEHFIKLPSLANCDSDDLSWIRVINRGNETAYITVDPPVTVNMEEGTLWALPVKGIVEFTYDCEVKNWIPSVLIYAQIRHREDIDIAIPILTSTYIGDHLPIYSLPPSRKTHINVLIIGEGNIGGHTQTPAGESVKDAYTVERYNCEIGDTDDIRIIECRTPLSAIPSPREYVPVNPVNTLGRDNKLHKTIDQSNTLTTLDEDITRYPYDTYLFDRMYERCREYVTEYNIANISVKDSSIKQWIQYEDNSLIDRVKYARDEFWKRGLRIDFILFAQGETDNKIKTPKSEYKSHFLRAVDSIYALLSSTPPIYLALTSYANGHISSDIRDAQTELIVENDNIIFGADIDSFQDGYRLEDGTYLNKSGVIGVVEEWLKTLPCESPFRWDWRLDEGVVCPDGCCPCEDENEEESTN
jgi:hypothetical protein